jgi:DNA-binding transcriptional regulator WhiA
MNRKSLLTVLLLLLSCGIGLVIGRANIPTPLNTTADAISNSIQESAQENNGTHVEQATENKTPTAVSSQITDGQRKMLESFGLNPDEVTITPEMVACAEAKLGVTRIKEIQDGATPSFLEGASLITCYK